MRIINEENLYHKGCRMGIYIHVNEKAGAVNKESQARKNKVKKVGEISDMFTTLVH